MKTLKTFAVSVIAASLGLLIYCGGFYIKSYEQNLAAKQGYEEIADIAATSDGEKTKEYNMVCDDIPAQYAGKRLDAINECLASEELHDMVTLKKLMNSYVTKAYVSEEIFKKID